MYIYVVRHGQSRGWPHDTELQKEPFHPAGAKYEPIDPSLTRLGHKQADLCGRFLSEIDFDAAFSGPLHRHIDTAKGILQHQKTPKKLEVLSDLTEMGLEGCDIIPEEIYDILFPGLDIIPCPDPSPTGAPRVLPQWDEKYSTLRVRAKRVVDYLRKRFSGSDEVLVVSSALFGGIALIPVLLELTDEDNMIDFFEFQNTGITVVEITDDGKRILHCANEGAHLALGEDGEQLKFTL
ncbi:MAG: histidine phosphatase family protein [Clostridia bacterium]|nr:histidine phosphatase family protein [Clostridia bacterium]